MPRLVPLDLNKLTSEQKKAADAIIAGPRGGLRGPFDASVEQMPDGASFAEAASFGVVYTTAYHALRSVGQVAKGCAGIQHDDHTPVEPVEPREQRVAGQADE